VAELIMLGAHVLFWLELGETGLYVGVKFTRLTQNLGEL
jgi:hypothetical protein